MLGHGYGVFVETLKGHFVAIGWYLAEAEALEDANALNGVMNSEEFPMQFLDFTVRPLNYEEYQRDRETY